jgi:hypothetical protein
MSISRDEEKLDLRFKIHPGWDKADATGLAPSHSYEK